MMGTLIAWVLVAGCSVDAPGDCIEYVVSGYVYNEQAGCLDEMSRESAPFMRCADVIREASINNDPIEVAP